MTFTVTNLKTITMIAIMAFVIRIVAGVAVGWDKQPPVPNQNLYDALGKNIERRLANWHEVNCGERTPLRKARCQCQRIRRMLAPLWSNIPTGRARRRPATRRQHR